MGIFDLPTAGQGNLPPVDHPTDGLNTNDVLQYVPPLPPVVGAGVGVAEGDPTQAAALFTEAFQALGNKIGGDVGGAINQLAPGLGEAAADVATIVAGGLDGNDQAVSNAEARLTALEGDGLSSLGHWVDEKLQGELGAGIQSAT